eukprot:SAG25_NODE_235_length_11344_cov_3.848911_13_plen_124_part_00
MRGWLRKKAGLWHFWPRWCVELRDGVLHLALYEEQQQKEEDTEEEEEEGRSEAQGRQRKWCAAQRIELRRCCAVRKPAPKAEEEGGEEQQGRPDSTGAALTSCWPPRLGVHSQHPRSLCLRVS